MNVAVPAEIQLRNLVSNEVSNPFYSCLYGKAAELLVLC